MVSGKELARTVSCRIWKEHFEGDEYYASHRIFNRNGEHITPSKATGEGFCHMHVLFQGLDSPREVRLLQVLLQRVSSTGNEKTNVDHFEYYGFDLFVVS